MTTSLTGTALDLPVRLGRPRDPGWVRADRLLEQGSPLLEERLRRFADRIAAPSPAVAASLLLEAYAGLLAAVGFGCLLGAGVVPALAAGNVSLRIGPGGVPDLVALHERWDALDGAQAPDPDLDLDRDALGRLARGLLDGHLGPL